MRFDMCELRATPPIKVFFAPLCVRARVRVRVCVCVCMCVCVCYGYEPSPTGLIKVKERVCLRMR